MGKIGKKLIYKKNGTQYNVGLYSSTSDVGANYITLRVDSALAYAQLGSPGSESATSLLVRKAGTTYAVRSQVEDPTVVSKGSVGGTGVSVPAVPATSGSYYGVGQNVAATWYSVANWTEIADSSMTAEFTVTINPSISLSDVDHYRLKWGANDLNCPTDGGVIAISARTWKVYTAATNSCFFKVQAENASNVVLYSSPVYGPVVSPYNTKAKAGIQYHVDKADSAGNNRVRVYDGNTPAVTTGGFINDANTKRWFFVATTTTAPWAGGSNVTWTAKACADTCSCNCNYCTCNCNYCTCNCNYCACNCNYSPCSCSSGN